MGTYFMTVSTHYKRVSGTAPEVGTASEVEVVQGEGGVRRRWLRRSSHHNRRAASLSHCTSIAGEVVALELPTGAYETLHTWICASWRSLLRRQLTIQQGERKPPQVSKDLLWASRTTFIASGRCQHQEHDATVEKTPLEGSDLLARVVNRVQDIIVCLWQDNDLEIHWPYLATNAPSIFWNASSIGIPSPASIWRTPF